MLLGRKASLVTFYTKAQFYSMITLCLPFSFFMAFSLPEIPHIDLVFTVSLPLLEFTLYEGVDIVSLVLYL